MDMLSEIMIARRAVKLTSPLVSAQGRQWLAAANDTTPRSTLRIAPIDQPELPVRIRFEGISTSEARAALAAFPGGKRFVLDS